MYRLNAFLALVTSSCIGSVLAAPQPNLYPRAGGGDSSNGDPTSIQKQIWIPLVIVAALFVLGTIFACCGRRFRRRGLLTWGGGAAQPPGLATGTGTRELTADQLVDTRRRSSTTTAGAGANGGTNRGRRPRRTRRTPSQISTHSLPAYMKDPGDEEIVIVRGADEMEDDIPITVEMPPLDEHANETPRDSIDISALSPVYSPVPHTATDIPLLHSHDHESQGTPALGARASFDSGVSSTENSAHIYTDAAPAYETVVLDDPAPATTSPISQPTNATNPANELTLTDQQAATSSTRRRSVFASIFNPRNSRLLSSTPASVPPVPSAPTAATLAIPEPRSSSNHARSDSRPSLASDRDPRRSRILHHRPSHSGSGSMFSLLSRTRSNGNLGGVEGLTSPSMISLHSISSPLTHTVVKTEFTYPKNGPTPDQLRLISSRESFARFGRPYGPDAIAYAASTSRVDLEPPPGFEEVAGSNSNGTGSSSSDQEGRGSPSSGSGEEADGSQANPSSSSAPAQIQEAASETHVLPDVPEVESPVAVDKFDNAIERSTSPPLAGNSAASISSIPVASPASLSEDVTPLAASPSPELVPSSLSSASAASRPAMSPSPPPSSTAGLASPPATVSSKAPPSAFKNTWATTPTDNSFPARAASRASSYVSYATAEESLHHSPTAYEYQFDLDGYESAVETHVNLTAPPTPRTEPRHMHDATDTTIMPER